MRNLELIKFTEIREEKQKWPSDTKQFMLGEVIINPAAISVIRNAEHFKQKILSFKSWPEDLDERIEFTAIYLNSTNDRNTAVIYAVGDMGSILKKLGGGRG